MNFKTAKKRAFEESFRIEKIKEQTITDMLRSGELKKGSLIKINRKGALRRKKLSIGQFFTIHEVIDDIISILFKGGTIKLFTSHYEPASKISKRKFNPNN